MPHELLAGLGETRLLAIIRGEDAAASVKTALTLLEKGFRYLEISLNTDNALEVIRTVSGEAPEGAHIGAGTVLTADEVHCVRDAGATAVTPAVAASVAESLIKDAAAGGSLHELRERAARFLTAVDAWAGTR